MTSKVQLYKERVRAGMWNDVIESAWARYKEGGRESLRSAVVDELADRAVQRYEEKIRAMFSRGGIELPPEPLTVPVLAGIIQDKTGIDLNGDLSPENVVKSIDAKLAEQLSNTLQVNITTVLDKEHLMEQVKAGVMEAIRDGRGAQLLSHVAVKAARTYATYKRRGIEALEADRMRNRLAQKRYRATHKQVWY